MNDKDIKVPDGITNDIDERIKKEQGIIQKATRSIATLEFLKEMKIMQYLDAQSEKKETERLLELGRQYDSILKGKENE